MSISITVSNELCECVTIFINNAEYTIESKQTITLTDIEINEVITVRKNMQLKLARDDTFTGIRTYIFPSNREDNVNILGNIDMNKQIPYPNFPLSGPAAYIIMPITMDVDYCMKVRNIMTVILNSNSYDAIGPYAVRDPRTQFYLYEEVAPLIEDMLYGLGPDERYRITNMAIDVRNLLPPGYADPSGLCTLLEAAVIQCVPVLVARLLDNDILADPNISTDPLGRTILAQILVNGLPNPADVDAQSMQDIVYLLVCAGATYPPEYAPIISTYLYGGYPPGAVNPAVTSVIPEMVKSTYDGIIG